MVIFIDLKRNHFIAFEDYWNFYIK